jgi:hypothetical protein
MILKKLLSLILILSIIGKFKKSEGIVDCETKSLGYMARVHYLLLSFVVAMTLVFLVVKLLHRQPGAERARLSVPVLAAPTGQLGSRAQTGLSGVGLRRSRLASAEAPVRRPVSLPERATFPSRRSCQALR